MKIFITGVAGFLGSHLADKFLEQGHEVHGCDNMIGGDLENVPKGVVFTRADCNDLSQMRAITEGMDIVYHCAATAHEGLSVFSPYFVTLNVYQNTMSVLSAAIHNKVKRFIYCTSTARYGDQAIPFTEDLPTKPQDPYGIAKVAAEMEVAMLCKLHGIEYVIAVPHNIIGPRQKYDDPFRNVAGIMINRMLQGQQPIIYGDGLQQRSFSFINDVVDPLVAMATHPVSGEVINVGPDDELTTIGELARVIADILGFDLAPIYMPDRPTEVKRTKCSADKARRLLGYEPKTSLRQGLEEMVAFIKERGPKPFVYHLPIEIVNEKTPKTWTQKLI